MDVPLVVSEFVGEQDFDPVLSVRITTGVDWINRELRDAAARRRSLRASQELYFEEQAAIFIEVVAEQNFMGANQVFGTLKLLIIECAYLNWPTTDEFRAALVQFALFRVDAGS